MSTYHGSLPNAGNDEHRYKGQVASNVDVGNSTSLESYVSTENDTILTVLQNVWNSVKSGTDAISEKLDNGEILMALTTEESNKLNAALDLMTETALLNRQCLSIFQSGGVANADLASTLAEAKAYAQDISHVNTGVLATANGGTGRNDGYANDVYISGSGNSVVTAKSTGQIGNPVTKNAIDANTILDTGTYFISNGTVALNYPYNSYHGIMNVYKDPDNIITQSITARNGSTYFQRRHDGTTWSGWIPISFSSISSVNIFISKDGNDANTGFNSDYPVLTWSRALEIARGISTSGSITFCFGAGEWGNLFIQKGMLNCSYVSVTNFTGGGSATIPSILPHFSSIVVDNGSNATINNVSADLVQCRYGSISTINSGYTEIGKVSSETGSYVALSNINIKVKTMATPFDCIFGVSWDSFLSVDNVKFTFDDSLSATQFVLTSTGGHFRLTNPTYVSGTFTGKKYSFWGNTTITAGVNPNSYPGTADGTGPYTFNDIPQQGVVLTSGDQEISGVKTFTQFPKIKYYTLERGTNPSSLIQPAITWSDKNNFIIASIGMSISTDGMTNIGISTRNFSDSDDTYYGFGIRKPLNNTAYTYATTMLIPFTNNNLSLGRAGNLWSQLYAGTATINTSDERIKSNIAPIPDAALDAWGEVNWVQYQFNDSIEKKGANARLHTGTVAQRIKSIFESKGLDATRYGLLCHDSWNAEDWDETIIDKEAVTETVKVVDKEAVYATRTVVISPAYTDEEGNEHPAETYEEQYEVSPEVSHEEERVIEPEVSHIVHHHRDAGDLYSLRYEECFAFEAAYQRRRADRIEARIAALEAKLA